MKKEFNFEMFSELSYEKFRKLAQKEDISDSNKVGFPDSYREGKEELILKDMLSKVNLLEKQNQNILEIGPGCSDLPKKLIAILLAKQSEITIIDSEEMLRFLPNKKGIIKKFGTFPNQFNDFISKKKSFFNVIILYSVLQYIHNEQNIWEFLDASLSMLSDNGILFLGDIPNKSMKERFLSSKDGNLFKERFSQNNYAEVKNKKDLSKEIDDELVIKILLKSRMLGFHAWVVPQNEELTFSNRREDIIIKKP